MRLILIFYSNTVKSSVIVLWNWMDQKHHDKSLAAYIWVVYLLGYAFRSTCGHKSLSLDILLVILRTFSRTDRTSHRYYYWTTTLCLVLYFLLSFGSILDFRCLILIPRLVIHLSRHLYVCIQTHCSLRDLPIKNVLRFSINYQKCIFCWYCASYLYRTFYIHYIWCIGSWGWCTRSCLIL